MSHTVILELNYKPGLGAKMLPGLLASLADTRAHDGAIAIEPYVDADNPDRILVWQKWESRDQQGVYLQWRLDNGLMESLADLVTEPPRFLHLDAADAPPP